MSGARLAGAPLMAALLTAPGVGAAQEGMSPGAWDPATEAAAEAVVAHLGGERALEIRPVVLEIRGLDRVPSVPGSGITEVSRDLAGASTGIVASVQEVEQAMDTLGAEETELEVRVDLPADVLFDFDEADIRPDAAGALTRLATVVRGYPSGRTLLEGHTDDVGQEAYNRALSERRAEAVKRWLVEREGIEAARLETRGWGESRPVADNDTDEGRQKNRRVEVVIRKEG